MHAAAVELLIRKANLAPEAAMAFGEAIDMTLEELNLVTVPILDARLAASEARLEGLINDVKAELVRWLFLVVLGNAGVVALLNALQQAMH